MRDAIVGFALDGAGTSPDIADITGPMRRPRHSGFALRTLRLPLGNRSTRHTTQFQAYSHRDDTPARAVLYRRPNVLISTNARGGNGSRQVCKYTTTDNGANAKALAERSGRRV